MVIDLKGDTFGLLTVLERAGSSSHSGEAKWLCRCRCGAERIIRSDKLRGGQKSCGCYRPRPPRPPKQKPDRVVLFKQRAVRREDLTGSVFSRLTVMEPVVLGKKRLRLLWRCRCECGGEKIVESCRLKSGKLKSCGCAKSTHGMSNSEEYRIWCGMLDRCRNPKHTAWKNYGGRGIEVRFKSFEEFYAEIGQRPSSEHSVDRINNDSHYEPSNVRWATSLTQANNQRPKQKRTRTHCKRGHELTAENTRTTKSGSLVCRKCAALKSAEFVARNREICRAKAAKWRTANIEKAREATRKWHRQKATERKQEAALSAESWVEEQNALFVKRMLN